MADIIDQVNLGSFFDFENGKGCENYVNQMQEVEGDIVLVGPNVEEVENKESTNEVVNEPDEKMEVDTSCDNVEPATTSSADSNTTPVKQTSPTPTKAQFAKGQRVLYTNPNTGVSEQMVVVGVHFDDFPNIYYTVQALVADETGYKKEKQTDQARLTAVAVEEVSPQQSRAQTPSPVTVSKEDTDNEKEEQAKKRKTSPEVHTTPISSSGSGQKIPVKISPQQSRPQPQTTPQQSRAAPQAQQQQQRPQAQQTRQRPQQQQQQYQRHPYGSFFCPAEPEPEEESEVFNLVVNFGGGRPFVVPVAEDTTVSELLSYLARYAGLPVSALRLVVRNSYINNGRLTMESLGLREGSRVSVVTTSSWYY